MADAPAQDTMRALAGKRRPAAYGPPSPRSSGSCHIGRYRTALLLACGLVGLAVGQRRKVS
jgi:hypothetical protein